MGVAVALVVVSYSHPSDTKRETMTMTETRRATTDMEYRVNITSRRLMVPSEFLFS